MITHTHRLSSESVVEFVFDETFEDKIIGKFLMFLHINFSGDFLNNYCISINSTMYELFEVQPKYVYYTLFYLLISILLDR